jgi:hypothetical protein
MVPSLKSNRHIPIAYRISVLERREGLNWIAHPLAPSCIDRSQGLQVFGDMGNT